MNVGTRPPRGLCAIAAALDISWPEIRYFCFRVIPGNVFGLAIQSVQLARGTVAPELRKELRKAVFIGWATVALTAIGLFTIAPADVTAAWVATYVATFSGLVAVLVGSLIFNRVTYGFYL